MNSILNQYQICPEHLSTEHFSEYNELGYLPFESVLDYSEVENLKNALQVVSKRLIQEVRTGEAENLSSRSWKSLKSKNNVEIQFDVPDLDLISITDEEAELKIRKLHGYHREHSAFVNVGVINPKIRGFIGKLIDEEVILKAGIALSKPPYIGSEKPWHQDNAYFDWLPLEKLATVWIALDDATVENGCMYVLPGQHKRGALKHFHSFDCEILPDRIEKSDAVPVELKAGGAMYFSAMLPHYTPHNRSPLRRRALQFQYRGINTRQVSKLEHAKYFSEKDGSPASCYFAEQ